MTPATLPTLTSCVLCALAACSRTAPGTAVGAPAQTATTTVLPGSVCDRKLIAASDVDGLLNGPVAETKNIPGDSQSCKFSTAGFSSVTISVRPGHGMAVVGMYTSGKMGKYEKSEPLTGVGDAAVRSLALDRVVARKGELLCEITGPGLARAPDDPMTLKLGALCNKIFARY